MLRDEVVMAIARRLRQARGSRTEEPRRDCTLARLQIIKPRPVLLPMAQ